MIDSFVKFCVYTTLGNYVRGILFDLHKRIRVEYYELSHYINNVIGLSILTFYDL